MPRLTGRKLTDDGSHTLDSERYSQTYHSINGALTEARHVFLDASGVSERLRQGLPTNVLEIGFGVGLNALLTADLASSHRARLNYYSFEHDLPCADVIRPLAYQELLITPGLFDALLTMVDQAVPAVPAEQLSGAGSGKNNLDHAVPTSFVLSDTVNVHLYLCDAAASCFKSSCNTEFHAIYLDAFSADANPECWSAEFIEKLANVLDRDGRLSTYSARGHVRRAMLAAGLRVDKLPGPPGKREMLVGYW